MAPVSRRIHLVAFDIDGTLTDGTTWYAGDDLGWVQRYSVRDGEACLRLLRAGLHVVPLSRNRTRAARLRMEHLGLSTTWVGVSDKLAALHEMLAQFCVQPEDVCFVGDGKEDAPILARVGLGLAVANAHPAARKAAHQVLASGGGMHALEEVELLLEASGSVSPQSL